MDSENAVSYNKVFKTFVKSKLIFFSLPFFSNALPNTTLRSCDFV